MMNYNNETYTVNSTGLVKKFIFISIIGTLLSIIGYYNDPRFFHSYLVCYMFFMTLSLGGLFFVLAHHIFGADWSLPLRRFAENLMLLVPLMLILSVPIILNFNSLYEWTDPIVEDSHAEHYDLEDSGHHHKSNLDHHESLKPHDDNFWSHHKTMVLKKSYLNKNFFFIRMAIYFIVWFLLISRLYNLSIKQKTESDKMRLKTTSAAGIAIFALTISFFGFDAIMSLDPSWYSTMFGVYIFAGAYFSSIGFVLLVSLYLRSKSILVDEINEKHYSNLGKIAFAFTVFWSYIGGFQYYIIWYGNLPEEINWFLQRWEGPFKYISLLLIIGHFIIPFSILIFNRLKRNKTVLTVMGGVILFIHWIDMYWLIMPNYFRDKHGHIKYEELNELSVLSWTDFSLMLAMGGLLMAVYWRMFKTQPVVAFNDSAYKQSITKEES